MPVNRLPSNPWSGWPLVLGMSAAVMAMRSIFSCAVAGVARSGVAASAKATRDREPLHLMLLQTMTYLRSDRSGSASGTVLDVPFVPCAQLSMPKDPAKEQRCMLDEQFGAQTLGNIAQHKFETAGRPCAIRCWTCEI